LRVRRGRGGEIDAAPLPVMLTALRLPTIAQLWPAFAAQADKEG
jgi:hypothetical protein